MTIAPLKLGKLPDRETTKITFIANAELNTLLENYALAYEREYGQREAVTDIIPHMLIAYIKADRGFRKTKDRSRSNNSIRSPAGDQER